MNANNNGADQGAARKGNTPCACQRYDILVDVREGEDGDLIWDAEYNTSCVEDTTRTFAPGHDAKLKSLAIKAGVLGVELRRDDGGVIVSGDPVTMVREYGFDHMVADGIKKHAERVALKAEKAAAKATKRATPEADGALPKRSVVKKPKIVKAKVGRWVYEGTVAIDGAFLYVDKKGDGKVAHKYELV